MADQGREERVIDKPRIHRAKEREKDTSSVFACVPTARICIYRQFVAGFYMWKGTGCYARTGSFSPDTENEGAKNDLSK